MTEKDLQKLCEAYLKANDIMYLHIENNAHNNKLRATKNKKLKGMPDFIVFLKHRITIFVELKTETGKQTPEQVEYEKRIKEMGFPYFLCRSFDEFVEAVTIPIKELR